MIIVLKFLLGILLAEGVGAILFYAALKNNQTELWIVYGLLALGVGFLAALWLSSVATQRNKAVLERTKQDFLKQREQLRVKAEREKTKLLRQNQQRINRERHRVENRAKFKVGGALAGVMGLGVVMLLTQFATLGLLTLTTAGGALGGYLIRARRDLPRQTGGDSRLTASAATRAGEKIINAARPTLLKRSGEPGIRRPEVGD